MSPPIESILYSLNYFIITLFVVYFFFSCIIPRFLSWVIRVRYKCSITIGRIGLPFELHDVRLDNDEYTMVMDRIRFTSSFVNSEAPKLLCVVIRSIRVVKLLRDVDDPLKRLFKPNRNGNTIRRKVTAPAYVFNLVQFLAIEIKDLHLFIWEQIDDKTGLYLTMLADKIKVDGWTTSGESNTSSVVFIVQSIKARVLENVSPIALDPAEHSHIHLHSSGNILLEWTFDLRLNIIFSAKHSGDFMEYFCIDIARLCIVWVKDRSIEIYRLLKLHNQTYDGRKSQNVDNSITTKSEGELIAHWLKVFEDLAVTQCIPKQAAFRIFETECRTGNYETKDHAESRISGLSLGARCHVSKEDDITFECGLNLGLIRIEPDSFQSLSVDHFTNYISFKDRCVVLNLDIMNWALRSHEKSLNFSKTQLEAVTKIYQNSQIIRTKSISDVIQSVKVKFDNTELDAEWNKTSGSLASLRVKGECIDLKRIFQEKVSSFKVDITKLDTALNCLEEGIYKPLVFDHLSCKLKGEKITAKLSGSRFQWIPYMEEILSILSGQFLPIQPFPTKVERGQGDAPDPVIDAYLKGFDVKVLDAKLLFVAENNLCLNADLASLDSKSDQMSSNMKFEGFEVFSSSNFSDCTLNPLFTIPHCDVKANFSHEYNAYDLTFNSDTILYWSPLLHLQLMNFRNRIHACTSIFKKDDNQTFTIPITKRKTIKFGFTKSFSIIAKLAKNHAVEFNAEKWFVEKGEDHFSWNVGVLRVKFDGVDIGFCENFTMYRAPQLQELSRSYRKSANLSQKHNMCWLVDINTISLTFPYGYNFASAFSEEFVTCFKWLKRLHSTKSVSPPVMWRDFVLKIKTGRIEVGDDPFEVKLRDNYELLEDEYFESVKRTQVLESKMHHLYKSRKQKVEELRHNLKQMDSDVYIQRSKKLYESHPMRTHLLLWELKDVQLVTMSDSSMFGTHTIKNIIKEMDSDSPWPAEGLEFTTLWCRSIQFDVAKWKVQLRDFPLPLMDSKDIHMWGRLAAAEVQATRRTLRSCEIEVGGPFESVFIERSLNSLKWYYDLNCDVESLTMAFGPCWEPVLAQCSLSFENIFSIQKDPSKPLPFWDKIRMMFHGRLYTAVKTLTHLLHASLNPYNTTEEMEITWTDAAIAWTNGKIIFEGDLNIYVRTASKYDDCRMLYLPTIRLTFKMNWICLGDANDHHAVTPCAPNRIPEYSSNQEHDSYRAFRSQNINLSVNLETRGVKQSNVPTAVVYGSTLRWFENLKFILSGTTRPTRRGKVFKTERPKKLPISRHYKKVRLSVSLNRIHVCYWVSFSRQSGVELKSDKLSSSSEHVLTLQPIKDGLIHRPKAEWSIVYVNSMLNDTEIWLQACAQQQATSEFLKPIEKYFFMSIDKLSYGREALFTPASKAESSDSHKNETPQHRLVVYELKGAWTSSNRDVAFALFDSFVKVQQLKKNLSTDALKGFFTNHDNPNGSNTEKPNNAQIRTDAAQTPPAPPQRAQLGASPLAGIQGQSAAASLLQKLISEAESHGVVFSEDLASPPAQQSLYGLSQSSLDDVVLHKWLIELVNCQVLLKGCETSGYVILSASKAHILQREHKPVWKLGTIVPKTTWVGALEGMQYYATVSAGTGDDEEENIQWVAIENIEERDSSAFSNVPDMVGSGQSVGGVVSETVGVLSHETNEPIQLQRIVARCKCEFFYTSYGDSGVDKIPSGPDIPPPPRNLEFMDEINKPVEAFTLMHHDLNIFTNSLQYAMIFDIVNNLVLYVDPKRKERFDKLQRLRLKRLILSREAQRLPIQELQDSLRSLLCQLRRLEKEAYTIHKQIVDDPTNDSLATQLSILDQQVNDVKEHISAKGEELHMMIMCYKEAHLAAPQRLSRKQDKDIYLVRVYEICFKYAQWRLTQTDGQLGIADLVLSNFLYTKTAKSNDTVDHLCELGYITVTNLLANQMYKEVLVPSHIHPSMPVDRQRTLRVYCRERPPVGGIGLKEHFEINIAPITIGMTYQFFKTMFKFCFPEKDPEKLDDVDPNISDTDSIISGGSGSGNGSGSNTLDSQCSLTSIGSSNSLSNPKGKKSKIRRKESKFYVSMNEKDDVEKMKERADRNMHFICIKIPEVPVRVSYRGEKEKNIEDVHDVHLVIPTLEYDNILWSWLDFLVAVRNHSKRVLLSQAIKQKLQIRPKSLFSDSTSGPREEDKAKLLLGLPSESKGTKKSLFGHKK